jgi:hypothetical protein
LSDEYKRHEISSLDRLFREKFDRLHMLYEEYVEILLKSNEDEKKWKYREYFTPQSIYAYKDPDDTTNIQKLEKLENAYNSLTDFFNGDEIYNQINDYVRANPVAEYSRLAFGYDEAIIKIDKLDTKYGKVIRDFFEHVRTHPILRKRPAEVSLDELYEEFRYR